MNEDAGEKYEGGCLESVERRHEHKEDHYREEEGGDWQIT